MIYKDLPNEYKELVRKRVKDQGRDPDDHIDDDDHASSLFKWGNTPERHDFWLYVNLAESESELPPIPEEK